MIRQQYFIGAIYFSKVGLTLSDCPEKSLIDFFFKKFVCYKRSDEKCTADVA